MRTELLSIGSELTSGATLNTNAAFLSRRLAEIGLPCVRQVTIGDQPAALREALREAIARADLLVMTGGLGPTCDDITAELLAEGTRRPLRYQPAAAAAIRRVCARSHRALQRAALRQAYLPRGATALPNPLGTAPGIWLRLPSGRLIVALPGVPAEMRAIVERSVIPRLRRLGMARAVESLTLRTAGIVELSLQALLNTLRIPGGVQIGLYPHLRTVDVRLTVAETSRGQARRTLARLERALRRRLGPAVYATGNTLLEHVIGELFVAQAKTLAVGESCTGGLIADRITSVPGSSRYFRGAVIAYHNDVKRDHLAVPDALLTRFGAVSAPVAASMARGVRRRLNADVGLAVTGIAGPSGGTKAKPVGLVYLALADARRTRTRSLRVLGDRMAVKAQAAQLALDWLRRWLMDPRDAEQDWKADGEHNDR